MKRLKTFFAGGCAGLLLAAGAGRAETVFWSDNFETNAGSRWTTNSAWQIGSPTYGPVNTPSGSRCAGTGLKANAPANADVRFICTNYNGTDFLTVPAADALPRLRFWQWFNFVNAGGYVELRTLGSTNWQTLSTTNKSVGATPNSGGGVWSRPTMDLSAYAGNNVQIAFHFGSGGAGYGNDPGWYLDDVAVVTGPPVFHNPETFENDLGDWAVDKGTWEVGTPTSGPNQAHGGTHCAATVLAGNYGWNMDTRLISPPFAVPPTASHPLLRFWQWYGFVNAGGAVEINNGTYTITATTNSTILTNSTIVTNIFIITNSITVTNVFIVTTNSFVSTNSVTTTNSITTTNNITVTQGSNWQTLWPGIKSVGSAAVSSGGWTNTALDLSSYANQTVQVAFRFQSGPSGWGNGPGWYVDEVALAASPVLTVPANQTIYAGQTLTVTNFAANSLRPEATFTFGLPSPSTNVALTAAGVLTWTNTGIHNGRLTWTNNSVAPGTNLIVVIATDDQMPSQSITNSFVLTILPPPAPALFVPATQKLPTGQMLTVTNTATNTFLPESTFTFDLKSPSTNVVISATGVLTWTNTTALPGTNVIYVRVTDNSLPPLSATNNFLVIILPPPPNLMVVNPLPGSHAFQFSFQIRSNTTWRVDASTNLLNWLPIATNTVGPGGSVQFTDVVATNFLRRFYRATLP